MLLPYKEEGNRKQSGVCNRLFTKVITRKLFKMSDFDEMVITIGPGSYTGVRMFTLTIAKTLNATMNDTKVKLFLLQRRWQE